MRDQVRVSGNSWRPECPGLRLPCQDPLEVAGHCSNFAEDAPEHGDGVVLVQTAPLRLRVAELVIPPLRSKRVPFTEEDGGEQHVLPAWRATGKQVRLFRW